MHAFRSILVDIDATAAVHPAFSAACDLARTCGARVTLVDVLPDLPRGAWNVVTRKVDRALVDERLASLDALARCCTDVPIQTAILRGAPAIAIVRQVLRAHHDLAVRAHARDLVPGRLYGAVDLQLLRTCPCPVWLVGPEPMAAPPHALAAVDTESDVPGADELNRTILDLALTLAERWHARVTALHAWSLYGEELLRSWMREPELREMLEDARASATGSLAALVAHFGPRAAAVRMECLKGEPHALISRFAAAHDVDLVVMGTVGCTGLAGIIMGNTAEAVIRQLRGSVLAVKPPGFVTPVTVSEPAEQVVEV
ncbi:MAG: universal stress protein [Acidobacteria bacterium]|nr:universal stress protein [Acidobacteriota bacterium]